MNRGTQTVGCRSHPATAAAAAAVAVEQETQSKENWISSFFLLIAKHFLCSHLSLFRVKEKGARTPR